MSKYCGSTWFVYFIEIFFFYSIKLYIKLSYKIICFNFYIYYSLTGCNYIDINGYWVGIYFFVVSFFSINMFTWYLHFCDKTKTDNCFMFYKHEIQNDIAYFSTYCNINILIYIGNNKIAVDTYTGFHWAL